MTQTSRSQETNRLTRKAHCHRPNASAILAPAMYPNPLTHTHTHTHTHTFRHTHNQGGPKTLCFNGHFPRGPWVAGTGMSSFWILLELRMTEVVSGDNWSYKTCKAPVKSSSSTNQHPTFYRPDDLPVTQPTVSKH